MIQRKLRDLRFCAVASTSYSTAFKRAACIVESSSQSTKATLSKVVICERTLIAAVRRERALCLALSLLCHKNLHKSKSNDTSETFCYRNFFNRVSKYLKHFSVMCLLHSPRVQSSISRFANCANSAILVIYSYPKEKHSFFSFGMCAITWHKCLNQSSLRDCPSYCPQTTKLCRLESYLAVFISIREVIGRSQLIFLEFVSYKK